MKRFLAWLALPAIAALLATSLAACIDLGGPWFPNNEDAGATPDAGHECEDHGGICEHRGFIQLGALTCDADRIQADYGCGSLTLEEAMCCVPRPPCESILVALGNPAPRCVRFDDCAAADRNPRGACETGICCSPNPPFTPAAPVHDAGTSG